MDHRKKTTCRRSSGADLNHDSHVKEPLVIMRPAFPDGTTPQLATATRLVIPPRQIVHSQILAIALPIADAHEGHGLAWPICTHFRPVPAEVQDAEGDLSVGWPLVGRLIA